MHKKRSNPTQGYISEWVTSFVFINRAMTHNIASIRVLEMVGFQKEGIARQNVHINGKWEDHQILAILNPYS